MKNYTRKDLLYLSKDWEFKEKDESFNKHSVFIYNWYWYLYTIFFRNL